MNRLKVAVVGLRGQAGRHIRMILEEPHADLYRVFYHRPAPPESRHLPITDNFAECHGADVVIISSPTPSHAQQLAALQNFPGYILLEKPAASRREDIEQLLRLPEELKSRIRVNFNFTYHELAIRLGELARSPMLGEPFGLDIHISHGGAFREDWRGSWRLKDAPNLGPLETVGIHFVHFSLVHFGECASAVIYTRSLSPGSEVVDTGMICMQMANGIWVTIRSSYAAPYGVRFELWGSNGYMTYNGKVAALYTPRDTFDNNGLFTDPPTAACWTIDYTSAWRQSLAISLRDLLDSALEGRRFDPATFDRDVTAMNVLLDARRCEPQ